MKNYIMIITIFHHDQIFYQIFFDEARCNRFTAIKKNKFINIEII